MSNHTGVHRNGLAVLAIAWSCGACSHGVSSDDVDAAGNPDASPGADAAQAVDAPSGADGNSSSTTIGDLRGMPDGAVDLVVRDVYVTYLSNIGYYIQAEPDGPALFVYLDAAPTVTVGNRVDLHVTSLTSYNGVKEIDGSEIVGNDNGTYDVLANLAQDLSAGAGVVVGEQHESELVRLYGARITSGTSLVYEIEYGSGPTSGTLRASAWEALGLCVGAVLDAVAIVDEDNGSYRIRNFFEADISNLNTSSCL